MWYWCRMTKHKKESWSVNFYKNLKRQNWNLRLNKKCLAYIKSQFCVNAIHTQITTLNENIAFVDRKGRPSCMTLTAVLIQSLQYYKDSISSKFYHFLIHWTNRTQKSNSEFFYTTILNFSKVLCTITIM